MKIVAIVRTRDEAANIERYCQSYSWVDEILVADGGSTDNTKELAAQFRNVSVRDFTERKEMRNGLWRNPEAEHLNFLVDWALERGADWIITDDADNFPNTLLQRDARSILEHSVSDFALVVRLFVYQRTMHFRRLAQPDKDGVWGPSLWAWRSSVPVRFHNTSMAFEMTPTVGTTNRIDIMPPYCVQHHAWPTAEVLNKKLDFYRRSGQIPNMNNPLEACGALEPLPEWAE